MGSYIRNPPQSSHTPRSELGCLIFVKLWQFEPDDRTHIRLNADEQQRSAVITPNGMTILPLYKDDHEEVDIKVWDASASHSIECEQGAEILILEGELAEGDDVLSKHSWLRLPSGSQLRAKAGPAGVRFWMKRNHLDNIDTQLARLPT